MAAAVLTEQGIWPSHPERVQEAGELEINSACSTFDFLGPARLARRRAQDCSQGSPWRPEDSLNPGKALSPSPARSLPGNGWVSAFFLGRGD